jgi:hypothetical protein
VLGSKELFSLLLVVPKAGERVETLVKPLLAWA